MSYADAKESIERYRALRLHGAQGSYLKQHAAIQQRMSAELHARYDRLKTNAAEAAFLNYVIDSVFHGIDLDELPADASRVDKVIKQFFSDPVILLAALEFNALNGEITQTLCEDTEVPAPWYRQRLLLLELFTTELGEALNNRLLGAALRLSARPARLTGFKNLHSLVLEGYQLLRAVPSPEQFIQSILDEEARYLEELFPN